MVVDGKRIAEKIFSDLHEKVASFPRKPVLTILTCNPQFETQKYLSFKKRRADEIGVVTHIVELPKERVTEDFISGIELAQKDSDGIIVQLPLPTHVDTGAVLSAIPSSHDVDALNPSTTSMLSPVVGALYEILLLNNIDVREKYVTIIGNGRLVGLPASQWFMRAGAYVSVVTKDTINISEHTKNADIIVCGAGTPGLLTPDMVKDEVIILDAGTSEDGGVLRGDADPACAGKAAIFTPVPGGIGPITIAILMRNVVNCTLKKQGVV